MKPDAAPEKSPEEIAILAKINEALAKLGSTAKWLKAPLFQPEYEILKGKKIIMIDDFHMILENMLPELMVASDGNAEAIHHRAQSLEELVTELLSKKPDIILLDYNLSGGLKGVAIARELYKRGFTGKIVGSSSEPERAAEFIAAGALGNISKDDETQAVKELARMVK